MSKYVSIKKEDIPNARSIYNNAGFKVEVFPHTKKGLTQSKWAKLRITNTGRNTLEQARNSRSLRNSVIGKYVSSW